MLQTLKRKVPILGNLYVGQVLFGALVALLVRSLHRHFTGAEALTGVGLAGRIALLLFSVLGFAVYLQNLHRHGLVPDYSLKCRYCNGPVNRYSEFCEHCGADLIAEEKLVPCPSCSIELYEGTKHCPECGTAIVSDKRKGKKKPKGAPPAKEGWDAPVDAVTGFPPDEERR